MSKVAVALLIGLIAIAAAIYYRPTSQPPSYSTPSYAGYEPVIREWVALSGGKVAKIKHLKGRFYAVRVSDRCFMVDVSKQYMGRDNGYDRFWWTGGARGPEKKNGVCDF